MPAYRTNMHYAYVDLAPKRSRDPKKQLIDSCGEEAGMGGNPEALERG